MNIQSFDTMLVSQEINLSLLSNKIGKRKLRRAINQFKRKVADLTRNWLRYHTMDTLKIFQPAQTISGINFVATVVYNQEEDILYFLMSIYCPNEIASKVTWIEVHINNFTLIGN